MLMRIIRDERGQDLIEYGCLASFVSVAAVATLRVIGVPVVNLWNTILTAIQ